jgi:hypothetical protein
MAIWGVSFWGRWVLSWGGVRRRRNSAAVSSDSRLDWAIARVGIGA